MKWPRGLEWVLPPLGGAALVFSFPRFSLFPLAWVGLAPFLYFLLMRPRRPAAALVGHLLFSFAYFGGVLYWIPQVPARFGGLDTWTSALVFLALLAALSLFLLPFTALTAWTAVRSEKLALMAAPGLWIFTEWLRNDYATSGFPWAALGYSQFPFESVIQISDLGSVYLLSYLVVGGSCALTWSLRRHGRMLPLVFLGLFLAANLYGLFRLYLWEPAREKSLKVVLVQPDIPLDATMEEYSKAYLEELPSLYRRAVSQGAEWVIFPEAQNPFRMGRDFYYTTSFEKLAADSGVPLVLNGARVADSGEKYFNTLFLVSSDGTRSYSYDKIRLVPFGEYLPFGQILGFASPLVKEVSSFSAGDARQEPGSLGETRFGPLICYEAIFPQLSRWMSSGGAQVLLNVTNDLWFGDTAAPDQHLEMAAFRAVENRRFLVRAANAGYSAVIDPWGRVRNRTRLFEPMLLEAPIDITQTRSLYNRLGFLPIASLILVSFLFCGLALFGRAKGRSRKGS